MFCRKVKTEFNGAHTKLVVETYKLILSLSATYKIKRVLSQ